MSVDEAIARIETNQTSMANDIKEIKKDIKTINGGVRGNEIKWAVLNERIDTREKHVDIRIDKLSRFKDKTWVYMGLISSIMIGLGFLTGRYL